MHKLPCTNDGVLYYTEKFSVSWVDLSAYTNGSIQNVFCADEFKDIFNFSFIRFIVSGFTLRSLILLNLSFVQGNKYGSICIFYMQTLSLISIICWRWFLFSASLSKIRCPEVCDFMSMSSIWSHLSVSIFMLVTCFLFLSL